MTVECPHNQGTYLDNRGTDRCKLCDDPYDDQKLDDFIHEAG